MGTKIKSLRKFFRYHIWLPIELFIFRTPGLYRIDGTWYRFFAGHGSDGGHAVHNLYKRNKMNPNNAEYLFESVEKRWFHRKRGFLGRKKYIDRIPPGRYEVLWTGAYSGLKAKSRHEDTFHDFSGVCEEAFAEFKKFWSVRPKFVKLGLSFKRGFFLWGPPGTGKTTVISRMADFVINELNGVVLYSDQHLADELGVFKNVCTDASFPVLVVMEDFEASAQALGQEKEILAFMDGEDQMNNVVFLATSNYPELTNKRIFDRPSRFDTVLYIGPPNVAFKESYILSKLGDPEQAARLARETQDFTIAHIKELIVCIYCLEMSEEDALAKIRKMSEASPNSMESPDRQKIGF